MTSHLKPVTIRPDVWSIPLAAVREPVDLDVIIPAFNESSRLPRTLAAMVTVLAAGSAARPGWTSRIVVVDDGSSDDTVAAAHILSLAGAEIVAIGCAQAGKGAAVLRGLRTSSARFVGFADADLSTPLDTLVHALAALEGGAAAAIASRHAPGSSVELLGQIAADGGRIVEIPVTWTDDPGSTLRPIRDGVAAVMALGRMRRDIRPSPVVRVAT